MLVEGSYNNGDCSDKDVAREWVMEYFMGLG